MKMNFPHCFDERKDRKLNKADSPERSDNTVAILSADKMTFS